MSKKNKGMVSRLVGFDQIKMGFDYTRFSLTRIFKQNEDVVEESFVEACQRFGIVGDADKINEILSNRFKSLRNVFYFKMITVLVLFVLALFYFIQSNIMGGIISFLLFFVMTILAMTDSFRCYQINQRSLGLLKEWISSPKNWVPTKFISTDFSVPAKEEE